MVLRTGEQYLESISHRSKAEIFVMGKEVDDVTRNPFLKPSVMAFKATYDAAWEEDSKDLGRAWSPFINEEVNRFTHIHRSPEDLAAKVKLLRKISHKVGACFQRCVGFDALNTLYITTSIMAEKGRKDYYQRFVEYLKHVQKEDIALAGAMTDAKGIRTLKPHEQPHPDVYVKVNEVTKDGIYVSGAKANITGVAASEEIIVLPTRAMTKEDKDYAVAFSVPLDTEGVKIVVGRQLNDARRFEEGDIDGLPYFYNHEGLVIFDNVFVPMERVFMLGDWEFSGVLVEIFSAYHRQGYGGCKAGLADVIIGSASNLAKQNGVEKASHIQDKLTEAVFLTETMYAAGIAASLNAVKVGDAWWVNPMHANVTKHLVTRFPSEITKITTDIAGGMLGTAPSEWDLKNPKLRGYIEKYMQGMMDYSAEDRLRMTRLLENTSLGVAFMIESVHGAGSPAAQRIMFNRLYDFKYAEEVAKRLAGMKSEANFTKKPEPWRETDTERVSES
ncbi:4-hydroxyphenylacetate 3-hydroxylase family protein [Sulfuracidifex metallicus]|jgi:4-hydroxybutyryl-CoA dehydratase/vinylacetyl-CoA-Delta-isomerase|uniref:4-hydroxybutyryl-CoA dehydratase n=1 Tax=Sulfuracidifex metallicus DSM 6482 = JCM 9184 TaxID=523847 RepID=A0A6A9QNP3_SULME|nr:4-hydroxyphenylacetate 3-hydroxylase family protein [Sulfuracidifex metallicus]MCY0849792.1 4-hydroxyphenylacetate 3-hydroxylase family protein [Sulfuracidifex metallicus]MUN29940.1 4-hydroxybutyryl-CoA dehydratase [Sulfuracidifex metallicus DSM 6482 = JCM 9184]WOE51676.1 4-hydroxyphenylacetate 3-hydroxylase family protein [Sulfuracidifex metallicus DSM 6482 = JCM 9184]